MLTVEVTGLDTLRRWAHALATPLPDAAHAEAGAVVQQIWQDAATGTVLPPMTEPVHSPALAASVRVQADPDGATVSADPRYLPAGRAAYDMKPGLTHGPKSRMGRHGRYNIIPMRPKTADIPASILAQVVAGQSVTSIEGIRSKILNGGAPMLAFDAGSGRFQVVSHYTWQTGLYTGMRIGRHPDYPVGPVVFRTVSERSPAASWWMPAQAGSPLTEAVRQASAPLVTAVYSQWWEARLHAH